MVDPDRVRRLLTALERYRNRLAELADVPSAEYLDKHAYAGRYLVQAAAQLCIDLALHVIASEGWEPPSSFRDSFTVLASHDAIDRELAGRLRNLAGLRNRLVHLYEDVDDRRVQQALPDGLADFDDFTRAIAALVTR